MEIQSGKIIRFLFAGQKIAFFVTDEDDLIQRCHIAGRFYELEELQIISRYFTPGGCFVDIGAHLGNHTIYASKFLSPSRVICLEPNIEVLGVLMTNIQLNEITHVVDLQYLGIALSDTSGTGRLHQPQTKNTGAMQVLPGSGEIRVAVGDDLLHTEAPTFLKIDVEGMEMAVLRGLERLISKNKPVIFVEVSNDNFESFEWWRNTHKYLIADRYRRYPQNENFLLIPC